MKFKKSAVAICVSSTLLATSLAAQVQTDAKAVFTNEVNQASQLVIELSGQPAIHASNGERSDYRNEVNSVSEQQERLFQAILAIDPTAKLVSQTRLLSNAITIEVNSDSIEQVKELSNVSAVYVQPNNTRNNIASAAVSTTTSNITAEGDGEEVALLEPYLGSATAGSGASVAIISTGIDYTLPIFGGSGEYGVDDPETPPAAGSYLEALAYGALGPSIPAVEDDPDTEEDESVPAFEGYDGFPTSVVVGGWDFNSENYGNDGNPIDQNLAYASWNGWQYPTGTGTQLASIVTQLAPGASLYAYKVYNVSESYGSVYGRAPQTTHIVQAMEHALDPNQDGDISDRVDVILLDAGGAAGFYQGRESGGTTTFHFQQQIQKISALGITVVTHAGENGHGTIYGEDTSTNFRSWISWEGSAPAAVTVGSVERVGEGDAESVVPTLWSPKGPVRGSKNLKPEVVTFAKDVPVVLISNADATAPKTSTRSKADTGSARIAAAIAVIKAAHPNAGPAELKALLANTANNNVNEINYETNEVLGQAEVNYIGHGTENVAAAIATPVVAWDAENAQPYLQFGNHEVAEGKTLVRNLTLRNLSDNEQTYQLTHSAHGVSDTEAKAGMAALSFEYPASVNVPANQSVTVAVTLTVDGTALPVWPLTSSADYTDANYKAVELNGYFNLSAAGQPELNLAWAVQARPSSTMDKATETQEYPQYLGWDSELQQSIYSYLTWAENYYPPESMGDTPYVAYTSSFANDSTTATTFETYPTIIRTESKPSHLKGTYGHTIKSVGGGIYDDARCESNKKISVAVNLYQPADNALANHLDKIGTPLFFYDLFSEKVVDIFEMDVKGYSGTPPNAWDLPNGEGDMVGQTWVEIDENGQPATFYIDYNKEYDYTNPTGRYAKSQLPVRMAPDGTNVVSEICVDELAHHDISDAVDDPSLPAMVTELDEFGNVVNETVDCDYPWGDLEQMISWGELPPSGVEGWYSCSTSTGHWDTEGFALDAAPADGGVRVANMIANTERGVVGQNELLNFFDQNFGFVIATDRDAQSPKGTPIVQTNLTRGGYFAKDIYICESNGWGQEICAIKDLDRTGRLGFAKKEDGVDAADLAYSHVITLEPGEEAAVAGIKVNSVALFNQEAMVISTDDNFALNTPIYYGGIGGGSVIAQVRAAQEFTIAENAAVNTVVGEIKLDVTGLFAAADAYMAINELSIVNVIPGSPFAINQETNELYVANPAALDYESNQKIDVEVQSSKGQALGTTQVVTVWINNVNDIAPELVAPIATVTAAITNSSEASFSIDITGMFIDAEGDTLTYTVSGLPAGLSYANGMITGSTEVEGTHTITVTASDGVNQSSSSFDIVVEDETTSSGSFGGLLLAFAGLTLFRRRK